MTGRTGRPRLSIGLQLVLLILACLAATHVVVFAAIALLPPPRPPLYRLSEIAAALQGGPLETRFGRPMARTVEASPPPFADMGRRRAGRAGEALALTLGRPRAEVRFAPTPPSAIERIFRADGRSRQVVFAHRRGERPPAHPPAPERFEIHRPPPHAFHGAGAREMVLGDFTAALRRPDGRWTVVRSSPEPFPTEWQKRALLILAAGFVVVAPAGLLFARRITAPPASSSEPA